jgi:hypothetical protein
MFHWLSPSAVLETLKQTFSRAISVLGQLRPRPQLPTDRRTILFNRMHRLRRRYEAFAAHASAGTLPPPRPAKPEVALIVKRQATRPRRPRPPNLAPGRKGWLIEEFPEETLVGPFLARLLEFSPELRKTGLASPEATRLLRSIFFATNHPAPAAFRPARRSRRQRPAPNAPAAPIASEIRTPAPTRPQKTRSRKPERRRAAPTPRSRCPAGLKIAPATHAKIFRRPGSASLRTPNSLRFHNEKLKRSRIS